MCICNGLLVDNWSVPQPKITHCHKRRDRTATKNDKCLETKPSERHHFAFWDLTVLGGGSHISAKSENCYPLISINIRQCAVSIARLPDPGIPFGRGVGRSTHRSTDLKISKPTGKYANIDRNIRSYCKNRFRMVSWDRRFMEFYGYLIFYRQGRSPSASFRVSSGSKASWNTIAQNPCRRDWAARCSWKTTVPLGNTEQRDALYFYM